MNRFRTGFVTKKADYPLNIEKVISGKPENLKIYGNSYQETKETKNLLDLKNDMIPSKNYNGIEFVNNGDGTFSVSGTATANTSINILNDTFINELESGVDYVLYTSQPYNVNTFNISVVLTVDDDVIRYIVPDNVANRAWESITHARLALYINAGETIDTAENVKIMLCKSSTLDVEYEEYKVMPSPDFPSEVQNVGEKTNICPYDISAWEEGYYRIEDGAKWYYAGRIRLKELLPVKPNTTYYFDTLNDSNIKFIIRYYNSSKSFLGNWGGITNKSAITTNSNTYYLGIILYKSDSTTITYNEYKELFENGSVKPFICLDSEQNKEFNKYKIPIKMIGQNLFNKNDLTLSHHFSIDEEDFITVTYDNSNGTNTIFRNVFGKNLPVKSDTNYAIVVEIKRVEGDGQLFYSSILDNAGQFAWTAALELSTLKSNSIFIEVLSTRNNADEKTGGLRTYVQFKAGKKGSVTFRISVLSDTTITSENFKYQPYIENTTNIYLNEPLRKIDNYADYIDFKNKKVIRKIKEDVIDGDEKMYIPTTPVTNKYSAFTVYLTETAVKNYCNGMCDVSLITTNEQQWMNETSITKGCFVLYDQQRFFIRIKKAIASTIEEFQTYLQKNNLNIYYPLKTPIEEKLELPNITLFENSNNIFIETKISPNNLELEYKSKKKEKEE